MARIEPQNTPQETWRALQDAIGARATLIDRYQLEAIHLGIAEEDLSAGDRERLQMEVLPVLFPGWRRRGEGSPIDPIVVEEYDRAWPNRFDAIRSCLERELGDLPVAIEHVGSTAVPGLAAKPVIDVMVGVPDVDDEGSYVAEIESCGVSYRSADDGHRYFKPMPPLPRTVQIHVVNRGSEWHRVHVLFRDYLRAHPLAAQDYAAVKREVAAVYATDRLAYNAAKTDFILDHLEIAEAWAAKAL